MNPQDMARIKPIYIRASRLHNLSKRSVYLAEACQGDEALRAEVDSLLAQDDKTGHFMGVPSSITGKTLLHYDVVEEIGKGGMGVVYKARDLRLNRIVVLKTLAALMLTKPAHRRRFIKEARCAAALNHPNIVTIFGLEQIEGIDFIVMEYVAGETLAHLIPHDGLPAPKAIAYARQLATALIAAHAKGIAHRDLKTGNIMITDDGLLKVLDFGLAGLVKRTTDTSSSRGVRRKRTLGGTPEYMAPEQIDGHPGDHRSDIYAFGVILYEMLSGAPPFCGRTPAETCRLIQSRQAPELPSHVPEDLRRIVSRCLEKKPADRIQSAEDLLAEVSCADMAATPNPAPTEVKQEISSAVPKRNLFSSPFFLATRRVPHVATWLLFFIAVSALVIIFNTNDFPAKSALESDKAPSRSPTTVLAAPSPQDSALYDQAAHLMETKRWAEAEQLFSRIVAADPKNTRALYNRGSCRLNLMRWREAIPDFTEVVRREPRNDRAYQNRAVSHMNLKMYSEALADLNVLIGIKPSKWAYTRRASVRRLLGDEAGARVDDRNAEKSAK